MALFILWVILAIVTATLAGTKGRSRVGWFVLSVLLTPLVLLVLLVLPPVRGVVETNAILSGQQKRCPYCAELIRIEAVRCRHCQAELRERRGPSQATRASSDAQQVGSTAPGKGKAFEVDEALASTIAPRSESVLRRPVAWVIGASVLLLVAYSAIRSTDQASVTQALATDDHLADSGASVFDGQAAVEARGACRERLLREPGITSAEIKVGPGLDGVVTARVNGEQTYWCHATKVAGHVLIEHIERVY